MPTGHPATPPTPRRRSPRRPSTLTDSATLSGGYNPTGTITFYLFAPGVTPNGNDSNNVYSDTVTVNGNGTYTTAAGHQPGRLRRRRRRAPTSGWPSTAATPTTTGSRAASAASRRPSARPARPSTPRPAGRSTLGGITKLTDSATLVGRLQPDRHDHLLPVRAGRHAQRHRQQQRLQRHGHGQRQRHVHHGRGQQPRRLRADDDRHLPVGGRLQRRREQQRGRRHASAASPRRSTRACSVAVGAIRRRSASGRTRTARPSSTASTAAPPPRSWAPGWRATSRTCSAPRTRTPAAPSPATAPRASRG